MDKRKETKMNSASVSMGVFRQLLFDLAMDMTGGKDGSPNAPYAERLIDLSNMEIKESDLEKEAKLYRAAAKSYGVDAQTMLSLAKSQIKTSADNIRMMERVQKLCSYLPLVLTSHEIKSALASYDGDNSKPYCDLVYAGLKIIQELVAWEKESNEWWMCGLS